MILHQGPDSSTSFRSLTGENTARALDLTFISIRHGGILTVRGGGGKWSMNLAPELLLPAQNYGREVTVQSQVSL